MTFKIEMIMLGLLGSGIMLMGIIHYLWFSLGCMLVSTAICWYKYHAQSIKIQQELKNCRLPLREGLLLGYPETSEQLSDIYIRDLLTHDLMWVIAIPFMVFFVSCLHIVEALLVAIIYYAHIRRQQKKIQAFFEDTVINDKANLKLNAQGVSFVSYKKEDQPQELDFCKWTDIQSVRIFHHSLMMTSNDEIYLGVFNNRQEVISIIGTYRRFT